jgi:hypothetical protein
MAKHGGNLTDYNPTDDIFPGDSVCFGPRRSFFEEFYVSFEERYKENTGPFKVLRTLPEDSSIAIDVEGEERIVPIDVLVKFYVM